MALQANAEANFTQASPTVPAKENKRGSSAVASNAKAKSTTTTPTKANNDKAATKTSAAKNEVTKITPVNGVTNAGVKKRSTPAPKTKAKGKKEEVEEAGCDGAIESCPIYLIDVIRYSLSSNGPISIKRVRRRTSQAYKMEAFGMKCPIEGLEDIFATPHCFRFSQTSTILNVFFVHRLQRLILLVSDTGSALKLTGTSLDSLGVSARSGLFH